MAKAKKPKPCAHPLKALQGYGADVNASRLSITMLCTDCGTVLRFPAAWHWPIPTKKAGKFLLALS